jgi:gliding motility-associated-like protein
VGFDAAGNIYIPDSYNQRIRKVNTAGIITTVAGTGATGKSGNGGPAIDATFNGPFAVVVDNAGNLYVDDRGNSEIRKIDNTGTITDYAGNGIAGYSGDGGAAVDGEFTYPEGIAIDHSGNCYLADTYNYVIRKVSDCQLPQISQQPANDAVCLGGSATFSVTATNATGYLWGVNSGSGWLPLGDGGIYSGSATSSLSISSVSGAMNDNQYVCEVLSACGTTTTLPVVLTVSSTAPPTLTISASDTTVCSGTPVSFMATPTNGGAAPSYQWLLNGVNTGTNSPTYTDGSPAEGDIVSCALTIPSTCVVNPAAASNAIVMTVNPVPTVALMRDTIIALGQSITLDATVTVGAGGSVASYTWVPAGGLNNPAVEDPVAAPISSTTYQLTVETGAGCTASGKVTIGVFGKFEMPNAFTPNGDGKNDIFRVPPSEAVNVISFAVYNRWAARVFMTTNSGGGWDGTLGGQAQPAGTYVWQIEYRDALTGKSVMVIGTVILVR